MPTDTSDYTPSETETVTDNTNELVNTLDDDYQEEAIRRRMDELYIAKQESMVRQQMAKLVQQKEQLDEVKKEAQKIYTDKSLLCPLPDDAIYKIAKERFDRETGQQQVPQPTTSAHKSYQQKGAQGGQPKAQERTAVMGFQIEHTCHKVQIRDKDTASRHRM